ncbi:hypothetical protein GE061_004050 [Apolygus lucorum]|uniref:Uncharacterized protein n=1 Tax=Apolygus lucorum TaxID=248454 RepID=A0A8S9WY61_APOLU|nr:hypothetical protein GE061_004050 [Apolygus lucorum]
MAKQYRMVWKCFNCKNESSSVEDDRNPVGALPASGQSAATKADISSEFASFRAELRLLLQQTVREEMDKSLTEVNNRISSLVTDVNSLHQEVSELRDSNVVARLNDVEERITQISSGPLAVLARPPVDAGEILAELEDRRRRSSNIMLYGVLESTSGRIADRIEHDSQNVRSIVDSVKPEHAESIVRVNRVGKPPKDNNPRPLRVVTRSPDVATGILVGFRSAAPGGVSASADRTELQRSQMANLRKELERQMTERQNEGKDVTIKYVNGDPKIVPANRPPRQSSSTSSKN